jgi:hypothetical protein
LISKNFVREEKGRKLLVLDITSAIQSNKDAIVVDSQVSIIKLESTDKLLEEFKIMEEGYRRTLNQCEALLEALGEK